MESIPIPVPEVHFPFCDQILEVTHNKENYNHDTQNQNKTLATSTTTQHI